MIPGSVRQNAARLFGVGKGVANVRAIRHLCPHQSSCGKEEKAPCIVIGWKVPDPMSKRVPGWKRREII